MKVSCELAKMNLKKSGKNSFLKFEYYELSDFLPQLYKLCLDNLLFLKVDIEKDKAVLIVKDCETEAEETFTHTFHFNIGQTSDKVDVMQREGCIATYMRRYLLINAFGIIEPDGLDNSAYMKYYKENKDCHPDVYKFSTEDKTKYTRG